MADYTTIAKNPTLEPGHDYRLLRQVGLDYIESLGSQYWTDYNIHDPGITILELLSYAITDLGYRTAFNIKDLLAPPPGEKMDPAEQAFFTAREILTVNPWTVADYRKLLIDIPGIKNAWLQCMCCPCDDMFLYANCKKSALQYAATEHTIIIKGMYDVQLEFEDDFVLGDLNSGKILYPFNIAANNGTATIEMRLPSYKALMKDAATKTFLLALQHEAGMTIHVQFISGNKKDNLNIPQADLYKGLRNPLYATFTIIDGGKSMVMQDIPFTVWLNSDADGKVLTVTDLQNAISDATSQGILRKYIAKIVLADRALQQATNALQAHRNLCEDFCSIDAVETEDIAICADLDVTPDSDIEKILAEAYYQIDQYFSPDIQFFSLKEMLAAGYAVDTIFNGPPLGSGFIKDDQLASTQLKKSLYASDIIAILMNIPGVLAVRNLILSPYDKDGNRLKGEQWVLPVDKGYQPRLYLTGSKFLVFKNGLPFLPDKLELQDTLKVIEGHHQRPKFAIGDNDLPVPPGHYYELGDYYPLQYSLPATYGVGYRQLPVNVSLQRKAQAQQLKAYLLFFEQLLLNYLEQLRHVGDLFSVDYLVDRTYFSKTIGTSLVDGIDEIYTIDAASLQALSETEPVFLNRRNRFLDHLMARFGEQFNDYALMLYSYTDNKKIADKILINDKIAFIEEIPFAGSNRARAYNYKDAGNICNDNNIAGLKKRIQQLLGIKELDDYIVFAEETDAQGKITSRKWQLEDENGLVYLTGKTDYSSDSREEAVIKAKKEINDIVVYLTDKNSYDVRKSKQWVLTLLNGKKEPIAENPTPFSKKADGVAYIDTTVAFVNDLLLAEKILVVEHLLLRPRNKPNKDFPKGDPLLSICIPPDCKLCGEEDPYSFRLTIVMNGEKGLANSGIEFRRFAETTIRMEIPAHLGLKICWVTGKQLDQFEKLYCAWQQALAKAAPDAKDLHQQLKELLDEFSHLKSVYPKATLHDCIDGDDQNRVYLNQTII